MGEGGQRRAGREAGGGPARTALRGHAGGEWGGEEAKSRIPFGIIVFWLGLTFALVMAGYAVAFGTRRRDRSAASGDAVLAEWLVAHGLHYGLGGTAANVVTADSGGRAVDRDRYGARWADGAAAIPVGSRGL